MNGLDPKVSKIISNFSNVVKVLNLLYNDKRLS